MIIELEGGWLGALAALWNADGLGAWAAKLIGVLVIVFGLTALSSLGFGGKAVAAGGSSASRPRRLKPGQSAAEPRARAVPPRNRKKKQARIVRRYRPRSHPGTLRPLTRNVALKLVNKPAPEKAALAKAAPAALRKTAI